MVAREEYQRHRRHARCIGQDERPSIHLKKPTLLAGFDLALSMAISGSVDAGTSREAGRLGASPVHLNHVERRARADGVVTGRERAHMRHEENQQSRRIYRQMHDAQS